ncbi:hypothetical protein [Halorussus sp. AFM4]|uniref:hypothetical protein n=1 Tax=Halorussus sp. AFM4 TaxID=3421651 RepID=UPI003EBA30FB
MTDPTRRKDGDRNAHEPERTDPSPAFEFDCEFCDEAFLSETVEAVRDRGATHLETHRDSLLTEFADRERGRECDNDCGYVFPVGVDEVAGFECRSCGHDNFESFAHRYLYWQIERS